MKRRQPFFWQVGFFRAAVEATCLLAILLSIILPAFRDAPELVIDMSFISFALLCGALAALRFQVIHARWLSITMREIARSAALSILLMLVSATTLAAANYLELLKPRLFQDYWILFLILFSAPAYLAVRVFSRLWLWWEQLRRRRFLWALTHAHLLIVVFMGLLFLVISTAWVIFFASQDATLLASLPPDPVTSILSRLLIWGLILIFLTIALVTAGVLVILPPSAVFSYLVARSMTYRWKALADAAEQMRRGDLSARVEVQGEDEVARLQESFNVMAQALQDSSSALQAERDRVRSLLIAQRELAANISHELRTPVSTVNGYLDYALGHWDEIEPGQSRRDLQVMSHEMQQLAHLIEDLFTLSRAEVDRLSLDIQPVSVIPLLQQAVAAIQKLAWEVQRVEVVTDLPPALPPVQADASRLEQIVRNLLQNGIRHTPPGGFVSVSAALAEDWVRIEVVDSGEGIAAQDLPHIWERFYRSQAARRLEDGGAGIGLALVRELVDAMQGRVEVASQPGEGSTFTVYLRHVCDTDSTDA